MNQLASEVLQLLQTKADYADFFYENSDSLSIQHTSSSPYAAAPYQTQVTPIQGLALHAIKDGSCFLRTLPGAMDASKTTQNARKILEMIPGIASPVQPFHLVPPTSSGSTQNAPPKNPLREKTHLMQHIIETAHSYEPSITSCKIEYQEQNRRIHLFHTDPGSIVKEEFFIRVRLSVAIPMKGRTIHTYALSKPTSHLGDLAFFAPNLLAKEVVQKARILSEARPIKSGKMPVIFTGNLLASPFASSFSSGNAGVWLHEAVGHSLEADHPNALQKSLPEASWHVPDGVTIYDKPTPYSQDASPPLCDDEGVKHQKVVLVHKGHVSTLLSDRCSALTQDLPLTGNGRRETFQTRPCPRMTTLHMEPGHDSIASMIASVKHGLCVNHIQHGFHQPEDGLFHLFIQEAYAIENGHLTHPVTNIKLTAPSLHVLNHIQSIGNDIPPEPHYVRCKKNNQVLHVGFRAPSVLFDTLNVIQMTDI